MTDEFETYLHGYYFAIGWVADHPGQILKFVEDGVHHVSFRLVPTGAELHLQKAPSSCGDLFSLGAVDALLATGIVGGDLA